MRFAVPLLLLAPIAWPSTPNSADPSAVTEVLAGKRTTANAAWWGFNEEDSTDALQAAIRSGARRVIIPNMTRDWIVRPIALASNQEILLEPGTVISAKRGEYRERGVSVLAARNVENVTIRGYGATIRMNKIDYVSGLVLDLLKWDRYFGAYPKAEWRMTLTIANSSHIKVSGLTLRDSGGDGVYIDGGRDVLLEDLVCDNHYRQGMSIISAENLLARNCVFRNTWGTPPCAGVDIEPDSPKHFLRNLVFRDCAFADNLGDGIEIFLAHLTKESGPVSILFERCRVTSSNGTGIRVTKVGDTAPGGSIEFRDTTIENTEGYGVKVQDKSPVAARVRFVRCTLRDTARNRMYKAGWTPLWIHAFRPELTTKFGGVDFVDCSIEDRFDRPAVTFESAKPDLEFVDITGTLRVRNPHGVRTVLPTSGRPPAFNVIEAAN